MTRCPNFKRSSLSLPMIWLCIRWIALMRNYLNISYLMPPMYQTSPHGLSLLQRLSNEQMYRVSSQPDSRESISYRFRVDARWLLCCCQLLLEAVNLCLELLRQVTIRDSLLAYGC